MSNTERRILYIFTRTPLHVGAGESVGAIDQPIIRERPTGFPVIPGSSIKGVLRDVIRTDPQLKAHDEAIFGSPGKAGCITFGEAKIIAFPVRSAKGSFALITCPLALERFLRELPDHSGWGIPPEPEDMTCLAGDAVTISRNGAEGVVLEEYRFNRIAQFPAELENYLLKLLEDPVWSAGKGRFVLLSNGDFTYFVTNACEVGQHVGIDPDKGTAKAGALYNLEAVPAETLFFAPVMATSRAESEMKKLEELVTAKPVLQFGGDSTTGLGFCSVRLG